MAEREIIRKYVSDNLRGKNRYTYVIFLAQLMAMLRIEEAPKEYLFEFTVTLTLDELDTVPPGYRHAGDQLCRASNRGFL